MNYVTDVLMRDEYKSSRPHQIGRPPKLTEVMIEQICDLVIAGSPIADAARMSGVSESTIYRWLALGKKPGADAIYVLLVDRLSESSELSEFELLQDMRRAAKRPENWRAIAWLLERRFPETYGKRETARVGESNNGQVGETKVSLTAV